MFNSLPSERSHILGIIPPSAVTTARTSATFSASRYGQLRVIVLVGDASASSIVTLIRAADASAGSSQAIATAGIGGTATTDDNNAVVFNISEEDMFDTAGRTYFGVTLGAGAALTAAVILGERPRHSVQTPGLGTVAR